jgi:hypothetical protein
VSKYKDAKYTFDDYHWPDYIRGQFSLIKLHYLPMNLAHMNVLEWDHCINSLAVGMVCLGSDDRFSQLFE